MRVVRLKTSDDIKTLCRGISREHGFTDPDFATDVYCLFRLKGDGLPDDALISKMADFVSKKLDKPRISVSLFLKKRVSVLTSIKATVLFRSAVLSEYDKPIDAVRRILDRFARLNTLNRQSICESCDLFKECEFGKMLGKQSLSPSQIMNEKLLEKVHPECPDRPAADTDAMRQAAEMLRSMTTSKAGMNSQVASGALTQQAAEHIQTAAERAEADALVDNFDTNPEPDPDVEADFGHGESDSFNATLSHKQLRDVDTSFVDRLTKSSIELWHIARKILKSIEKEGINYKPSKSPEDKRKNNNIRNVSDVTKIHSHQHAMPEEVFDRKLAEKSLTKRENLTPEAKKQLLFVLHDVSDSMNMMMAWNDQISFSCASMAKSIILAFIEKVRSDKGIFCYAPFEGKVGRIQRGESNESFDSIESYVSKTASNGYGTNIQSALVSAMQFISKQSDDLKRAEILLLTDGLSNLDYDVLKREQDASGCKIHTVLINSKSSEGDFMSNWMKDYQKQMEALKNVSETFVSLVSGEAGVQELIDSMSKAHTKGNKNEQ